MSKKNTSGSDRRSESENSPNKENVDARRDLLKALGAGSVVATSKALPDSWGLPLIESLIIPAHAQSTLPSPSPSPTPTPIGTPG